MPGGKAAGDVPDTRAAGGRIRHEPEMRAVEREVGARVGGEPGGEREVAVDEPRRRRRIVDVLAEEVDRDASRPSARSARTTASAASSLRPGHVAARVPEGEVPGEARGGASASSRSLVANR